MRIEQLIWKEADGWKSAKSTIAEANQVQFVLVFGDSDIISSCAGWLEELKSKFPNAKIVGCSTSGNIMGGEVLDSCLVATAVYFEKSRVEIAVTKINGPQESHVAGQRLIKGLPQEGLRHVLIISDGLNINGSELALGISALQLGTVKVTGGLAGDGTAFKNTWVVADKAAESRSIVAVGFYGDSLSIKHACRHGWEDFGVNRMVS